MAACRPLQRLSFSTASPKIPDFAFAFDIDGVLVRSNDPLPNAPDALSFLQHQRIPFILLTNGGGKPEEERVADLTAKLKVPLDTTMFVQSHTPFADLDQYKDKTILVCGGDGDKCRYVAEKYGFKSVVIPGDIFCAYPEIWPFSTQFLPYYQPFARPLPKPILQDSPSDSLKIDAIFVYNDPRDWGLDATIILDILLSHKGILGTMSPRNGDIKAPNHGYLQDGQPPLFYSNPDLWWAAKYHLPRLGQGGFREAMEGLWTAVTGGPERNVELYKTLIGKPYRMTYEFAERRLNSHRKHLFSNQIDGEVPPLQKVYMVGDNPESDIRGANSYKSPLGTTWESILVRTGVYQNGEPAWSPKTIQPGVWEAVKWALDQNKARYELDLRKILSIPGAKMSQ
ncbi:HAD superfamily hydrolase [Rhizodiscina lignyota]|uniref:HAD superfamily hydrolase n=1 Tax=Rhizodiscina lignyota TaxID=1504668 RepID=A0A9P4IVN0_9PEZI|nr:HAD superfamily hydrolase [Rhizodiscina lignyota]